MRNSWEAIEYAFERICDGSTRFLIATAPHKFISGIQHTVERVLEELSWREITALDYTKQAQKIKTITAHHWSHRPHYHRTFYLGYPTRYSFIDISEQPHLPHQHGWLNLFLLIRGEKCYQLQFGKTRDYDGLVGLHSIDALTPFFYFLHAPLVHYVWRFPYS